MTAEHDRVAVRRQTLGSGDADFLGSIRGPARKGAIFPVDTDSTGEWIAYAVQDRLYVLPLSDLRSEPRFVGRHDTEISRIVLGPNGILACAGGNDATLWSLSTPTKAPLRHFDTPGLINMTISPDGKWLVAGRRDSTTALWRLDGPPAAGPVLIRRGGTAHSNCGVIDRKGEWLATVGWAGAALWPLTHRFPLKIDAAPVYSATVAPDASWFVTSGPGGLWYFPLSGPEPARRNLLDSSYSLINSAPRLVSGSIANASKKGPIWLVPISGGDARELTGFREMSYAIDADPERNLVAAAGGLFSSADAVIRIWDLTVDDAPRILDPGHGKAVWNLAFQDQWLWEAGWAGLARWNLETGEREAFVSNELVSYVVAAQPNLIVYLAGPLGQGAVHILNPEDRSVRKIESFPPSTMMPAVHRGVIIAGDSTGPVRVASLSGGEPHLMLGHKTTSFGTLIDARTLVTGSFDGQIRIWELPDLEKTPFHLLPYEEILAKLRAFTNYRVVRDDAAPMGYRAELAPFPGWESTPDW